MIETPPASRNNLALRRPSLLDMSERGVLIIVGLAALASALLLLWLVRDAVMAAGFMAMVLGSAALLLLVRKLYPPVAVQKFDFDWSLAREMSESDNLGVAITDRSGKLVCANEAHEEWFGATMAPSSLSFADDDNARLVAAGKTAWRDGLGTAKGLNRGHLTFDVEVLRAGQTENHLLWRFKPALKIDVVTEARRLIEGAAGHRMGEAGLMASLVDAQGRIISASREFAIRAGGRMEAPMEGRDLTALLEADEQNVIRFSQEGKSGAPLRLLQIPIEPGDAETPTLVVLLDESSDVATGAVTTNVTSGMQSLMAKLPLGLALVDRDGHFLFLNDAFSRVIGADANGAPVYPSDMVVREDKAAVSDTIRRHASGQATTSDIAIRLNHQPEEPVALTIASARGLGEAAVLLSIKDSSEESRLKKQVAQQTKMQAVGQLAGGVAHDFNNILTAIIGNCDLMLLRHTPGDSDYDDIQQIKNNSNRAAGLTRQLLAFSRQQTLRPQILQLPDVVSEISNLLKRLMGETVEVEVKHGRNLGAVRADPGQLEQVIVNLAVNARDAMPRGGTLTIQTFAMNESDVEALGHDIMTAGEYTALSVSDTGTGIAPEVLSKIFEPFFTTKDVGKGTGLGLSTVYGIVKQSGGFIFADSVQGQGTKFTIYLPVHAMTGEEAQPEKPAKERSAELWGSGTVLLVEDEDMVRAVAERALTRHGYEVLTADNGEAGLELLAEHEGIDLILTDVVMPIMDGPAMAAQARTTHPDVPILFMSGYAEEQLRKSISLANVNFLPKPFSVQQLAEAVRGALGSPFETQ